MQPRHGPQGLQISRLQARAGGFLPVDRPMIAMIADLHSSGAGLIEKEPQGSECISVSINLGSHHRCSFSDTDTTQQALRAHGAPHDISERSRISGAELISGEPRKHTTRRPPHGSLQTLPQRRTWRIDIKLFSTSPPRQQDVAQ